MRNLSITISYAQSIDGRIATATGESRWISGQKTLKLAHKLRRDSDAVMVGVGTVQKDDPELTCRLPRCPSPARVVFDSNLTIPMSCKIVKTAKEHPSIILSTDPPGEKRRLLNSEGVEVVVVERGAGGQVSIEEALKHLQQRGMNRLLLEGGSRMITAFIGAGVADRLVVVVAPIIIGEGISAVGDLHIGSLKDALKPRRIRVRRMGQDVVWVLTL
jgi:riboflavin-specific deaminase-like protein